MSLQQMNYEQAGNNPFSLVVENQLGFIYINSPARSYNLLQQDFIEQLRALLGSVIYQRLQGVIFISAKPNNFIRGFDLASLENKNEQQLADFVEQIQSIMREVEYLKIPTVAAIQGDCYGVGLELALACKYRLATNDSSTLFAMPQVRSGLIPFAGGTQRLVKIIGLKDATDLMLTGNKINARNALALGLIDEIVESNNLLQIAQDYIFNNSLIHKPVVSAPLRKLKNLLEYTQFTRNQALEHAEAKVSHRAFGNYPATETLIKVLKIADEKQALKAEQTGFCHLFNTEQSQVLRNLERSTRVMKLQYKNLSNVNDVKKVAILGSGFLGAGLAYLTAHHANLPVRIKDINLAGIQQTLNWSYKLLQKEVANGNLSQGRMRQKMQLISGGERFIGRPSADFVIEAVYEDLALKQKIMREAQHYFGPNAVFVSNTSTLSIAEIAKATDYPEQVIGFHYFSPVSERKMVEIIPHSGTSAQTIATAIHFAIQQGKTPLLVADRAGFFVNRIVTPYLLEAIRCVIDGEAVEFVDRSLQEFGFGIGPLAMVDEMGLDVIVKSLPNLQQALGNRFELPTKVEHLIENDRKGMKNRRGFYLYHSQTGERIMVDKSIYHVLEVAAANDLESEQIVRRCILMMLNEAAWCLQDGVIQDLDEGNVASVFGAFFPDFRGGIYAYMQKVGAKNIVAELKEHVKLYGERFTPCAWLLEQAERENHPLS